MQKGKVDKELKGNTLRVYVYALKTRKVGVREVQRALGLSNPSLAQYHLNKLHDLGLVREENGEYEVATEVKVDVMRDLLRIGTLLIPRFVFYAIFFSVLTAYLTAIGLTVYAGIMIVPWFIILAASASAVFWYETILAWRSSP